LGGKFEAIVESEKYGTLTVNELFSKLKSAEVDRGMTAKIEGPSDSHSLALICGSKGKTNANPSTRMFSLFSLVSVPDEEFDMLGENELALLTRRFERLHENRVNMRRNTRTCFQCGKPGHFVTDFPEKVENKDNKKHKSKTDGKYRSRCDHKSKHNSYPVLHEKTDEMHAYTVSLEAKLKEPIPTSCFTCELHALKDLELAHYVDRLHDENDELRKLMGWLSGHEPQLSIMIETYKR
jgi:hypothetical protein